MSKQKQSASIRLLHKDNRLFTLDVTLMSGPVSQAFLNENPVVGRTIQMRASHTLQALHSVIFDAYGRFDEHLYEFQIGGKTPHDPNARRYVVRGPGDLLFSEDPDAAGFVEATELGALGLQEGDAFAYWFDFGDDWWHRIAVLEVAAEAKPGRYPKVIKRVGESPPQYMRYAEDDEDEEEDDANEDMQAVLSQFLDELIAEVPKARRDLHAAIIGLTDAFAGKHLTIEYKMMCWKMTTSLCKMTSIKLSGKLEGWAAGIVYSLGQVNFLTDRASDPYVSSGDIAKGFGISKATMEAKARNIRKALDLFPMHPAWCLPSLMDDNPLIWTVSINGVMIDVRQASREIQVAAYEQGLIPYIPGDE